MRVRVSSGRVLAYDDEGSGPLCVMIHGFTSARGLPPWPALTEFLVDRGYRCVRIDLPAHGQSTGELVDLTLEAIDRDLDDFLDSLGAEPKALIGHSLGSLLAARAARRREDVKCEVLVSLPVEVTSRFLLDLAGTAEVEGTASFVDWRARHHTITRELAEGIVSSLAVEPPLKPALAIVCARDRTVSPKATRRFAERAGIPVLELDSDHLPSVTLIEEPIASFLSINF